MTAIVFFNPYRLKNSPSLRQKTGRIIRQKSNKIKP
jgi:hypothetical protein